MARATRLDGERLRELVRIGGEVTVRRLRAEIIAIERAFPEPKLPARRRQVGTDKGVPGFSVQREIQLYVEGGMTPLEAIQAATIIPARVMQPEKDTGTIESRQARRSAGARPTDSRTLPTSAVACGFWRTGGCTIARRCSGLRDTGRRGRACPARRRRKRRPYVTHSPDRMTGSVVPLAWRPSTSSSPEPIMKSTCVTLRLPPARSKSSSLISSPPDSVDL
jgi:hypothetical protein